MDILNTTTEHEQPHQFLIKKASIGRRLAAFLIDHSIFSFGIFPIAFIFTIFSMYDTDEPRIALILVPVLAVAFFAYGFRDIFKGQSIGKRILGIGVRDINDAFVVPPISKLFLRQVFSFFWPIEFLVLVFSNENQKIGDLMAGTSVYNLHEYDEFINLTKRMEYMKQLQAAEQAQNTEQPQNAQPLQNEGYTPPRAIPPYQPYKPNKTKNALIIVGAILAFTIFVGAFIFWIGSIFRNHPSYHLAIEHIQANPEIVALIGEVESFGFMPTGNLSTSPGSGDANYVIRARGPYGEVRVFVELQMRHGGDWEIIAFNFVQIR